MLINCYGVKIKIAFISWINFFDLERFKKRTQLTQTLCSVRGFEQWNLLDEISVRTGSNSVKHFPARFSTELNCAVLSKVQ